MKCEPHGNEQCPNLRCRDDARDERRARESAGIMACGCVFGMCRCPADPADVIAGALFGISTGEPLMWACRSTYLTVPVPYRTFILTGILPPSDDED